MSQAENSRIILFGISLFSCDASTLGKYSYDTNQLKSLRSLFFNHDKVSEVFLLNTCNRFEICFIADSDFSEEDILDTMRLFDYRDMSDLMRYRYLLKNEMAIAHLFEVASGLDSQITGETEIFGQVKKAYYDALENGHCKTMLNRVLQKTLQCAKWIRSNTEIGRGKISVGSVSAELAKRIFEKIEDISILLVGSGEVGTLVAESLRIRGARNISIASRSFENAKNLSERMEANAVEINRALKSLHDFDMIVTASGSKNILISKDAIETALIERKERSIFLLDLSMPNNIDKSCEELTNAFLYNLEDLSKISNENIKMRQKEIEFAKSNILKKANSIYEKVYFNS